MEPQPSTSTASTESDLLQGWSKGEKLALLDALKMYGSKCTKQIAMTLPGKSEKEVIEAINFYKKKAGKHPTYTAKKKQMRKGINTDPLSSWAKVLTDTIDFKELQTETPKALHMIAEYEDFPPVPSGAQEHNIDFKNIYHTIGNALEGKELVEDKVTATVLEKCLLECASSSRAFIKKGTLKHFINNLSLAELDNLPSRDAPNPELASVRHLALQRAYNPLNIPEHLLKQSVIQKKLEDYSSDECTE